MFKMNLKNNNYGFVLLNGNNDSQYCFTIFYFIFFKVHADIMSLGILPPSIKKV